MTKTPTPAVHRPDQTPTSGGRWQRDPKTGALTPVPHKKRDATPVATASETPVKPPVETALEAPAKEPLK